MVAKQSRREGVYNRTGDLSVICFGNEEQRNECEAIKNRRKRYVACDDVAGVAESDKASLVACNNFMSLLLRKRRTNRFESCRKSKQKNNRHSFVSVIFWLGWQNPTRQALSLATILCPFCFAKDGLIGSNPAENLNKKITDTVLCLLFFGWGGRIRTYECSSQSAVSYRLTTPQY